MSGISFPSDSSGSSSSSHNAQFYAPPFEGNSSFQMNPLSSHPPRTPRVSMMSSSNVYGSSIYENKEEPQEHIDPEDEELEDQEDKVKELESRIRNEDVWREMFLTSNGRDKAFVRLLYSSGPLLRLTTHPKEIDAILYSFVSVLSHFTDN